ncbi:MAG: heavy metal transporter [Cytophagales bacterium]|nr:heavy metal transporter [Cytophagales bacterium]
MGNVIRPTYPRAFSIGLLLLIFIISCFLSLQIFDVPFQEIKTHKGVLLGMVLVSLAVISMVLILWEQFLFPIKLKEVEGGLIFRNHQTKLQVQFVIYCTIPAVFTFIYLNFPVNHVRFFIWAGVCMIPPVVEKIVSGINNYNDFLKLTDTVIEYKNNEKVGTFKVSDLKSIAIVKDESKILEKLDLVFLNGDQVTIDLDEMELDAFYDSINNYIIKHYPNLLIG